MEGIKLLYNGGLKYKMILIKNADVYAPRHIGISDILICGEKILPLKHLLKTMKKLRD